MTTITDDELLGADKVMYDYYKAALGPGGFGRGNETFQAAFNEMNETLDAKKYMIAKAPEFAKQTLAGIGIMPDNPNYQTYFDRIVDTAISRVPSVRSVASSDSGQAISAREYADKLLGQAYGQASKSFPPGDLFRNASDAAAAKYSGGGGFGDFLSSMGSDFVGGIKDLPPELIATFAAPFVIPALAGAAGLTAAGTASTAGTAGTLADLGLGGASYAPGAYAGTAGTAAGTSGGMLGSSAGSVFGAPPTAYSGMLTDAAISGATGGTGAAAAAIPSLAAPSITESALSAAGLGATGASALYPTLTNMSSGSNPLADFLAQEGGSLTDYPGLSDFLAQEGGGDFTLEGLSAPGGTASWWNTAKDALGTTKAALGAGNTLSSLISGGTALWGANQTANAAKDAAAEAKRQFDIGQANAAPWLNAGKTALGSQLDLLGLPGGTGNSESSLAQLQKTPGYQFRLNQGRKNLEASSAARGGMGSGKSGVAMQKYGQDYATNEYNNRLNQLSSLSGSGQVQANTSANAGQQYGTEAGNAALTAATARQSGILGAGSALSDWLNPKPKTPTLADLLKGGNYGY